MTRAVLPLSARNERGGGRGEGRPARCRMFAQPARTGRGPPPAAQCLSSPHGSASPRPRPRSRQAPVSLEPCGGPERAAAGSFYIRNAAAATGRQRTDRPT
jgi:hypothetical protein